MQIWPFYISYRISRNKKVIVLNYTQANIITRKLKVHRLSLLSSNFYRHNFKTRTIKQQNQFFIRQDGNRFFIRIAVSKLFNSFVVKIFSVFFSLFELSLLLIAIMNGILSFKHLVLVYFFSLFFYIIYNKQTVILMR